MGATGSLLVLISLLPSGDDLGVHRLISLGPPAVQVYRVRFRWVSRFRLYVLGAYSTHHGRTHSRLGIPTPYPLYSYPIFHVHRASDDLGCGVLLNMNRRAHIPALPPTLPFPNLSRTATFTRLPRDHERAATKPQPTLPPDPHPPTRSCEALSRPRPATYHASAGDHATTAPGRGDDRGGPRPRPTRPSRVVEAPRPSHSDLPRRTRTSQGPRIR